ncbi:hypothetical protein [Streptomyces sp. enrichment culture]|uniref:hypothetical protein n=1 Tax=Streptomyces sp. enrichment culture TaxID=1795815 RepID=UPI003F544B30
MRAAPEPRPVTVWSDLGCPWATLALHTLRTAARAREQDLLIDHRAFPLELFNHQPTPKYVESRCVSVPSEILDVAAGCEHVDEEALARALERGAGRAEIYEQFRVAQGPDIQGSPHLFAPGGYAVHNPGAHVRWTGDPDKGGLPRLDGYDPSWAEELLDLLAGGRQPADA